MNEYAAWSAGADQLDRFVLAEQIEQVTQSLAALGCEVELANPGAAWTLAASIRRALDGDEAP